MDDIPDNLRLLHRPLRGLGPTGKPAMNTGGKATGSGKPASAAAER